MGGLLRSPLLNPARPVNITIKFTVQEQAEVLLEVVKCEIMEVFVSV